MPSSSPNPTPASSLTRQDAARELGARLNAGLATRSDHQAGPHSPTSRSTTSQVEPLTLDAVVLLACGRGFAKLSEIYNEVFRRGYSPRAGQGLMYTPLTRMNPRYADSNLWLYAPQDLGDAVHDNEWWRYSDPRLDWILERDDTTASMVERFDSGEASYESRPVALFLKCQPPDLPLAYYFAGRYRPEHLRDERGPHIVWRRDATRIPVFHYDQK